MIDILRRPLIYVVDLVYCSFGCHWPSGEGALPDDAGRRRWEAEDAEEVGWGRMNDLNIDFMRIAMF